jgi:hypothetical protein
MGEAARSWVLHHYVNGRVLDLTVRYYESLFDRNLPEDSKRWTGSKDSALNPTY